MPTPSFLWSLSGWSRPTMPHVSFVHSFSMRTIAILPFSDSATLAFCGKRTLQKLYGFPFPSSEKAQYQIFSFSFHQQLLKACLYETAFCRYSAVFPLSPYLSAMNASAVSAGYRYAEEDNSSQFPLNSLSSISPCPSINRSLSLSAFVRISSRSVWQSGYVSFRKVLSEVHA